MSQEAFKSGHNTYRDYCTWPIEERWELINGKAYSMTPAPSRVHQDVTGRLYAQILGLLAEYPCQVYIAPFDVRLPRADEADELIETVVQPDVAVICDQSKLDAKGCRGAPDWIIEVLSPATAAKDHIEKRALYERHGVKEYWLVHPTDRVVMIYRLVQSAYGKPEISATAGQTPLPVQPHLTIDWERVFPP